MKANFWTVIKKDLIRKLYFFSAAIILITLINSCSDRAVVENSILIDGKTIAKQANFSELFDYAETIYLESNADCNIGRIDKIVFNNDLFFILDRNMSNGIFVFNRDGSFRFKVQTIGKGPGEYKMIYDFDLVGEDLLIFAGYPNKIIRYSMDGQFMEENLTKAAGTRFAVLNEDQYLIYTCGLVVKPPINRTI